MALLIDQFCEAIEEYGRRTGETSSPIHWTTWFTGGWRALKAIDRVDPATVPPERRRTLTVGEVTGRHTVDQVRDWLNTLVHKLGVDQGFLITALVRAIEDELEELSESYAKGLRNRRKHLAMMEKIAADPEELATVIEHMNAKRAPGEEPFTEATLLSHIEHFRRWSTPSLEDQRRNRTALTVWREVTAPIIDRRNVRKASNAFAREEWGVTWAGTYSDEDGEEE